MNFSSRPLLLLTAVIIFVSEAICLADNATNGLTEAERRGGWKMLFDGKTTSGWRNYRADRISDGWKVADGVLSRIGDKAGDIVSSEQYENFELSLEYRISKGGNSGLMFHVTEDQPQP